MDDDNIDPSAAYLGGRTLPAVVTTAKRDSSDISDTSKLNHDLQSRLDALSKLWVADKLLNPKGTNLPITSGFRSNEKQQQLYNNRGSNPNLVARPGESLHESGDAVDIHPSVPDSLLAQVGLHRPYGTKDPVHVQIDPSFQPSQDDSLIDPSASYLSQKGTYTPSASDVLNNQWQNIKNSVTSPDYWTKTLPKQTVSLADTALGAIPGAVQFVGHPFARLADELGGTDVATQALNKITQYFDKPVGKAFGLTNDPAYNNEGTQQVLNFVGQHSDKGAQWIADQTGMKKEDAQWFINAIALKAAPIVGKGIAKTAEFGAENLGKAVETGKQKFANAKEELESKFPALKGEENPNLRSVGAAEVPKVNQRINNAHQLLEPIDLSRDQATRDFQDVNWAREKAKDATTGAPLREHYAQQNEKILRNFDKEIKATGAQETGIDRAELGQRLTDVVNKYKKQRYQEVQDAYKKANESGETLEQVPYKSISDYIEKIKKDSPTQYNKNDILKIVEENLKANDAQGTGSINLRQIEDIRKLINEEVEPGTSNGFHGSKLKQEIDRITQDKGGDAYKNARSLNSNFMKEFEETPSVRNITAYKKGTIERAVPLENVVEKSMLGGPTSHVNEIFSTLEKAGPEGQQLINELKGVVGEHIKNEATKNVQLDVKGNPVVSPAKLDLIIKKLDKSGKLDLIFGKQGAERFRTLNDVSKDIYTVPAGSVNTSGSGAQIKNLIMPVLTDLTASAATGLPLPLTVGGTMAYKYVKGQKELNRVNEFINYGKEK
jgi:hypothetical protein